MVLNKLKALCLLVVSNEVLGEIFDQFWLTGKVKKRPRFHRSNGWGNWKIYQI